MTRKTTPRMIRNDVRKIRREEFRDEDERHDAEERSVQPAGAAEERHDHHLERDQRIEGDGRVDIGPARRHHRAGRADEAGADREEDELRRGRVDGDVAGDGLVVADDAQREAEARAADQPADQEDEHGERRAAASRSAPGRCRDRCSGRRCRCTLISYQVTSWRISSARPKVKITK